MRTRGLLRAALQLVTDGFAIAGISLAPAPGLQCHWQSDPIEGQRLVVTTQEERLATGVPSRG